MTAEPRAPQPQIQPPPTRGKRWKGRAATAIGLATVLATATTLAVASTTTGPAQALPATARTHLAPATSGDRSIAATERPQGIAIPHTPVGTQLSWLLGQFNGGSATITTAELKRHLSTHFLSVVPSRDIVGFLRDASDLRGSAVVVRFIGHPSPRSATAIVATPSDGSYLVRLTVEGRSHHLITSLDIDAQRGGATA
jgi:hypothetical protein